jgi:hypothetical protein
MPTLLEKTGILESTLDEEDSHFFLSSLLKDTIYHGYRSDDFSVEEVTQSIETFVLLHAAVSFAEKDIPKFWTPQPLVVFKFVMDQDLSWHHISEFKPFDGYLVQGASWTNGFYYIVSYKDFLIEANLYVDPATKEQYNYL